MRSLVILVPSALVAVTLGLSGCAGKEKRPHEEREPLLANLPFVYKMTVQQGNIITEEMVDQLELGMNRQQVQFILGTPLLADMFHTDRWDYLYTIRRGHQPMETKRLTLWFEDDQLARIDGFTDPDPSRAVAALEERQVVVEVPDWRNDRGIITRALNAVGLERAD
jgi:outer membrane protein assembly factor BamE